MTASPDEILDFWAGLEPARYWSRDDALDAEIEQRFATTHASATNGKLDDWLGEPDHALALVIVLDQFSRNLNRNSPAAYAQDTRCAHLVRGMMANGADRRMRQDIGYFVYLPLMHSEHPVDQQSCLEQMKRLDLPPNIEAAEEHKAIIDRFGRFPHRNRVLGRATTPEEQAFLNADGFAG